ncbi:hypothetical protein B0H14DRAFT_2884869, partial [Mycena olivaceomarginata]
MSSHLRRRLAELDAQIVEQKRVLEELQHTRSDVERELHATATYPVVELPIDITAEIFGHCVQVFEPVSIPYSYTTSAPIVISAVCRAWRDIALATPALWSHLDIWLNSLATRVISESGLVEGFIDRWLTRAGNRPFNDDLTLRRLRDIIHRWSHRVEYIYLDIGNRDIHLLGLDSANFPLLKGATLGCDRAPAPSTDFSGHFQDLSMEPWGLTKFEGAVSDLELFTLAPNLTELNCALTVDDSFPIITHRSSHDIIQYLALPALRSLNVAHLASYDSLESFLARSSPPLVTLSVHGDARGFGSYEDDAVSFFDLLLRCLPLVAGTLEDLEFSSVSDEDMLSIPHILDPLLNIRTVSFVDLEVPLNLRFLVKFLYERFDKLRSFKVVWPSDVFPFLEGTTYAGPPATRVYSDTIIGHLSQVAQSGMDIYLGTPDKNYLSM